MSIYWGIASCPIQSTTFIGLLGLLIPCPSICLRTTSLVSRGEKVDLDLTDFHSPRPISDLLLRPPRWPRLLAFPLPRLSCGPRLWLRLLLSCTDGLSEVVVSIWDRKQLLQASLAVERTFVLSTRLCGDSYLCELHVTSEDGSFTRVLKIHTIIRSPLAVLTNTYITTRLAHIQVRSCSL